MKSNMKNKSRYGISILMIILILMVIPTGLAAVTTSRTIDSTTLTAGNSTNVTIQIQNDGTQKSLSLKEILPSGWILTRGSDTADQFKSSTNEWVWFTIDSGASQVVTYKITVPSSATAGVYNINGNIITSGITSTITGDNTITVVNNAPVLSNGSFDFVASPTSATVDNGTNAIYTLTITNNDDAADTYSLVTTKPSKATVALENSSVTIGAGASSSVKLTVNSSTIGTYTVNVTAKSSTNKSSTKDVAITTTVTGPKATINDFNFVASPTTMAINVGTNATYTLTVSNIGGSKDTYSLVTNKPNNATVNLSSDNVTVGPGNTSDVTLTVGGSVTGTYTVNVTATSGTNKSNVKKIATVTNIEVATSTSPGSRSSGGSGGGTYPTFTATPVKTSNATAVPTVTKTVVPTTTSTTTRPTEAIKETPVDMTTKKGVPGFEIVLAIGMLGAIYILRRMK